MTDKSEDDYQFPDEEYVMDDGELGASEGADDAQVIDVEPDASHESIVQRLLGGMKKLWNRNPRVGVVLVGVVLLLVIFSVMDSGAPGMPKTDTKPTTTQKDMQPEPVEAVKPIDIQPIASAQDSATKTDLDSLKSQVEGQQSTVSQLASKVTEMNQTLDSMTAMQGTMQTAISDLGQQTARIADSLKKKKAKHRKPMVKLYFYLRAVVPGRAWIYSTSGLQTSVRLGEKIPQYGRVKSIDPERGVVVTSSGKTIQFSPEDL